MIICPTCREEIDEGSHFCDQCGQALLYCSNCGYVGTGRRCTQCGGLMVSADHIKKGSLSVMSSITSATKINQMLNATATGHSLQRVPTITGQQDIPSQPTTGIPTMTLINLKLNIRLVAINGAVIGRRQGPYHDILRQFAYVSGLHAQLNYQYTSGWNITDKHSSNGTRLNNVKLTPDVPTKIKNGDIITIANVNLQVNIK